MYLINTFLKEFSTSVMREIQQRPGEDEQLIKEIFAKLDTSYYLNVYETQQVQYVEPQFIKLGKHITDTMDTLQR